MVTEEHLRKELNKFGCGLEIIRFIKNDKVTVYPTRLQRIYKFQLTLRGRLEDCPIEGIMKHALSKADFTKWMAMQEKEKHIAVEESWRTS